MIYICYNPLRILFKCYIFEKNNEMKLAVIGATGMVGQVILKVLEERNFPLTELIPVASERSLGKKVNFKGKEFAIVSMQDAIDRKADIALFSAGGETS